MPDSPPGALFPTPPFEPLPESPAPAHLADELLLRRQAWIDRMWSDDEDDRPAPPTRAQVEAIARWVGGGPVPDAAALDLLGGAHTAEIPGLTLLQRVRLLRHEYPGAPIEVWLRQLRAVALPEDYRQFREAFLRAGFEDGALRDLDLTSLLVHGRIVRWRTTFHGPMSAWEHHADHPALIRSVLGVGTRADKASAELIPAALGTLAVIQAHGPLPRDLLATVAEYAVGPARTARPAAQQVLAGCPDGPTLLVAHLGAKKADARAEAATWIGQHGTAEQIDALTAALAEEPEARVRAALLGALLRLGVPADRLLSPSVLTAEAEEQIAAGAAMPDWLNPDTLPSLTWADGVPVAEAVPVWWVALADRIGDPTGAGLISRYLAALAPESADALGRAVLAAWVARDTEHPTEADVRADPERFFENVINTLNGVDPRTPEDRLAYTLRFRHVVYLASAIEHRGLLALALGTDGSWFADQVQRYIGENRVRRAQVEALLRTASAHPSEQALQVLIDVARRYRQKTVQALAVELVAEIAARRGWSPLQLADRTVPTAGLDDAGRLHLGVGSGAVVAVLTDGLTLSAPEPGEEDDPQEDADAAKELAAARSELKRIVTAQRARLEEDLLVQEGRTVADWQALLAHPILGRLAAERVWSVREASDAVVLVRPDADGVARDASGAAVDLGEGAEVTPAHAAVVPAELVEQWRTPRGKPLPQLAVPAVDLTLPERDGAEALEDFSGWIITARALHTAATKRGYQRAEAEDGGVVRAYVRRVERARIRVEIGFSGILVGTHEGDLSLHGVRFHRNTADGRTLTQLALADVPPVLLAEAHADYAAIAAKAAVRGIG